MAEILVIGSSNTDMVVKTQRLPKPGETLLGGSFFMFPGGKGANQAVSAARLGGQVCFICKVGDDLFGKQAIEGFRNEHINTDYCLTDPHHASGVALITINDDGENVIVVASGANNQLTTQELDQADAVFQSAEIILLQLETPISTIGFAIKKGFEKGKRVILNPAPAHPLEKETYTHLFLITPNETEAGLLTGIEVTDETTAEMAADRFLEWGVGNVIITMGAKGAFFKNPTDRFQVAAPKVQAVDTTAAGDVFNGALSVALAQNKPWKEAIRFASQAAAVSVTRMGAQASAPYLNEIHL